MYRCCWVQWLSSWMALSGRRGGPAVSRRTLLPGGQGGGCSPMPPRHIQPQSRTETSRAVFTVLSWWEQCPCYAYFFGSVNCIHRVLYLSHPPIILRNVLWGMGTSGTNWSLPVRVFLSSRYAKLVSSVSLWKLAFPHIVLLESHPCYQKEVILKSRLHIWPSLFQA